MASLASSTTSFAVIIQLDLTDTGYYKLAVRTQIPFDFRYLRFSVWDIKCLTIDNERATVGQHVKVVYETLAYKELKSLESASFISCENCSAFIENDKPRLRSKRMENNACKKCENLSTENVRVDTDLKLLSKTEKRYKYSLGIRLLFINEVTENRYIAMLYENDPIYSLAKELTCKNNYTVQGWAKDENGRYFLRLINVQNNLSPNNSHPCTSCKNTYKSSTSLSTHRQRFHPYKKN